MNKETYERLLMDVTEFDTEDVITTSGVTPGGGGGSGQPDFINDDWGVPLVPLDF